MSKHLDIADEIKDRLDAAFLDEAEDYTVALQGVDVIVDRQKDILTEVNKAVAKAQGSAVTILWTGFDRTPTGERMGNYVIRIYSRPVMLGDNKPADEIVERIDQVLNEWVPQAASANQHCHYKMIGSGADLAPDRNYLIYEMPFQVKI